MKEQSEKQIVIPPMSSINPTALDKPAYLLNVPFSLSADISNNAWMAEMKEDERKVDIRKAINQFLQLYHFMASDAVVYLLPTPKLPGLQDLVYCANMGVALEHTPDKNTVVLSNFSAENRRPETEVGRQFFDLMGYEVVVPPHHFEGDAELKHLYDNIYIGGYGTRSERQAYEWMSEQFDMQIIMVEEVEPYLYHLDCTVFPLTLVCTEMYTADEISQIEAVSNIIDVSLDDCFSGICNSIRLGNSILNASNIYEMKSTDEYYEEEKHKNRSLEDIASRYAFELSFFNLSEFLKSGALLSCMVMHLNRKSYDLVLL